MVVFDEKQHRCRLCGNYYSDSDMSEEHYPARNTGNEDVVAVDLGKMFDTFTSESVHAEIREKLNHGETLENITGDIFDTQLSTSLFPKGRTARTLCRKCNTFLGKYDEAYLRFFNLDGTPKSINGFQQHTKYQIIKAIYAKFLSIPEAAGEAYAGFLFLDKNDMPMVALHWEKYLEHIIQKYNKIYRIQMPKVTPHVCRHTFCSNMAKSGMNPKTLQYIMGHADISVTLNTYTHVNFDDAKEEVYRIANS